MVRFLFRVAFFLASVNFALSQSLEWTRFAPSADSFAVETPVAMDIEKSFNGRKSSNRYGASSETSYYFVFSDSVKELGNIEVIRGFGKASNTPATELNYSGLVLHLFSFRGSDGFYHRIVIVRSKKRVFAFQTTAATANDQNADRFMKSVEVDGVRIPVVSEILPQDDTEMRSKAPDTPTPSRPQPGSTRKSEPGSGNGPGERRELLGDGTGSKLPGDVTASTDPRDSIPLRILEARKPAYTELGRFYGVTGTVVIRLTFSRDGRITGVTPLKRLPFGLTDAVVGAANMIKFEPARRNNVPYTVVKNIQYSFDLY